MAIRVTPPVAATRRALLAGMVALPLAACASRMAGPSSSPAQYVGSVIQFDPALSRIIDPSVRPEVLATGYSWAEGPVWVPAGYLLFNDPGNNVTYRYVPGGEVEEFRRPSGLAGTVPPEIREAGANGMAIDPAGRLVFADSGTRAIAALDLDTMRRTELVETYQGKRFNSPNDLTITRGGRIYFTDPPYGFADADNSPLREVNQNGLYLHDTDGSLYLLDQHRRPNGVALSPDERTLYLALSDEQRPAVLAYTLGDNGRPVGPPRVFHDMQTQFDAGLPGLPDGLKVDKTGHVFATGPGGVHILSPTGQLLGMISTGTAVANCVIGRGDDGGAALYMTAHTMLARVPLRIEV
ncbi:SMP-30/gluconolactonase/LRE family protein [Croceicoccus marinus]|nr:SMP-30/gluconolactonase/LRE family protein [Croceicoccus marinus]